MNTLINIVQLQIIPSLAMIQLDPVWGNWLNNSSVFRLWLSFKSFFNQLLAPFSKLGSGLQALSFCLVVLLFALLPAPQFADDKGTLALIVIAAFILRLLGSLIGGKESFKPSATDMLVLAFLGINIIATAASHYLMPSLKGLSKLAVYVCAYFLFVNTLRYSGTKRGLIILLALLFSGFLESLYGIYQYKIGVAPLATWEDPNIEEKTTRIYGTLRNPNLLAAYFIPLIPLSLGLATTFLAKHNWQKIFSLVFLGIGASILIACILTGSRGAYIGIGATLVLFAGIFLSSLWTSKPKTRPWLLLAGVVLPLILCLVVHQFPAYEQRILSIFAGREHSSNSYRLNVYSSSWKMFLDSWWLGIGPGNSTFRLAYGLYMTSGFDALGTYSVPLEILVECGLGGLLIFFFMLINLLARAHVIFWKEKNWHERWIIAGAAVALVAMMLHGLVDTVFYRPQVQFIFWLLAAIIVGLQDKDSLKEQNKP